MIFDFLKRYATLQTDKIYSLPIMILMPHSSCNCRCVMCDIWKDNSNKREWDENTIRLILDYMEKLRTKQVVLSGGEALLHPKVFQFCNRIQNKGIKTSILSTGLLLEHFKKEILSCVDEIIVSLDGSEKVHNAIRRIPNAYQKLRSGVKVIKSENSNFQISGRCVIQKMNYTDLPNIINSAKEIGLDRISFLAADVSSSAFNHPENMKEVEINKIVIGMEQLPEFKEVLEKLFLNHKEDFKSGFIVESPGKLYRVYEYYEAFYHLKAFSAPRCNAPWVSAVIEADGTVRPCFFHKPYGNITKLPLTEILNNPAAIDFRKKLDITNNPTCQKCVCSLDFPIFSSF